MLINFPNFQVNLSKLQLCLASGLFPWVIPRLRNNQKLQFHLGANVYVIVQNDAFLFPEL